jgi:hypothetical protein
LRPRVRLAVIASIAPPVLMGRCYHIPTLRQTGVRPMNPPRAHMAHRSTAMFQLDVGRAG